MREASESKLVRLTHDLAVNRDFVASVSWDRGEYAYGPRSSYLIISMMDGAQHRIEHLPHALGGLDAYKIEKELLGA